MDSGSVNEGFDSSDSSEVSKQSLCVTVHFNDDLIKNDPKASHRVEWKNLGFEIRKKNFEFKPPLQVKLSSEKKLILQPQTGCINSGEMTALMGPSGAGKTTLLNAITGKCDPKYVTGEINFVSSEQKGEKSFLKMSYVPQTDYLHQDFSIRETLTFAYKFNMIPEKGGLKENDMKMKVEKLALDINLLEALDTKISNCSGGQVKRVSVAIELISNPNILILDEPTTGLDSMNAAAMITTIKKLLSQQSNFYDNENYVPPAVICAIHQPSIEVFKLFDQIYVLANGGKNIFSGNPSKVPEMLAMNNVPLTTSANPADFLLMLCQSGMEIKTMISELPKSSLQVRRKSISMAKEETNKIRNRSNLLSTMTILLQRQLKMLRYNPWPILIRFFFCILSTILLKSMFDHPVGSHKGCYTEILGWDEETSNDTLTVKLFSSNFEKKYDDSLRRATYVLDNVGYLILSSSFIIIVHSFMALVEVPGEIKIIMKEVSNNWYSINAHLTTKIMVSFFIIIFHVSIFVGYMSYMSSQELDLEKYLLITASWILLAYISELTGLIIGVLFHSDLVVAVLLQVYGIFPLILFSGYMVKPITIPSILAKVTYVSQLKHVFYAMMITVYGRGRCQSSNPDDFTFSQYLKLTPIQLTGRVMESNNITHETSDLISPVLGLPDNICLAQVINATRDYLSIKPDNETPNGTDYETSNGTDYEMPSEDGIVQDTPDGLSFPLSFFGINEDDLALCYYSLVTLFALYLFLCYLSFRRAVRINF